MMILERLDTGPGLPRRAARRTPISPREPVGVVTGSPSNGS